MKYILSKIPKEIPDKKTFLIKLLNAIFPELEKESAHIKPGDYKSACRRVVKELGVADKYSTSEFFTDYLNFSENNRDLYSVIFEADAFDKRIFGHENFDEKSGGFEKRMIDYGNVIFNLMNSSTKTMNSLISGNSRRIYKKFETASFFTWLLLKRKECSKTSKSFLEYCLKVLGIKMSLADLHIDSKLTFTDESFGNEIYDRKGVHFYEITDKGAKLLIYSVFLMLSLLGNYPDKGEEQLETFYNVVEELTREDIEAYNIIENAHKRLLEELKIFEPRSVTKPGRLFLEDFYVFPVFEKNGEHTDAPLWKGRGADKSQRYILTGRTGYGKTMYVRKLAKSIIEGKDETIVILINAHNFADLYHSSRYKDLTKDLAELFFMNIFSQTGYIFCEKHKKFLMQRAAAGKLILLADSFDELPPGELRSAFLKALKAFVREYCIFMDNKSKGADVLVASREMTDTTMSELAAALMLEDESLNEHICTIQGLDKAGKRALIENWQKYGGDDKLTDEIYTLLESNHFFNESAGSPYALTLICTGFGGSFGTILENYYKWLERSFKSKISDLDDVSVKNALSGNLDYIKKLALECVISGNDIFDDSLIDKLIYDYIGEGLSGAKAVNVLQSVREMLLMQSGFITFAPREEERYTFTDNNLKFLLAAKRTAELMLSQKNYEYCRERIFKSLSLKNLTSLLVPLIGSLGAERADLVRLLLTELLTRMIESKEEEELLLRALIDIFLNRYKPGIVGAESVGTDAEAMIAPMQRLVLMRILSSAYYKPDDREKEEMRSLGAYKRLKKDISKKLWL